MCFAGGDVRHDTVSHKNDHGPSYRPYRALQRRRRLKIDFREIFGIIQIPTFATLSAQSGHRSRLECPLLRRERKGVRNEVLLLPTDDASSHPSVGRPDQREHEHPAVYLSQLGNMFGLTGRLQLEVGAHQLRRYVGDDIHEHGQC